MRSCHTIHILAHCIRVYERAFRRVDNIFTTLSNRTEERKREREREDDGSNRLKSKYFSFLLSPLNEFEAKINKAISYWLSSSDLPSRWPTHTGTDSSTYDTMFCKTSFLFVPFVCELSYVCVWNSYVYNKSCAGFRCVSQFSICQKNTRQERICKK